MVSMKEIAEHCGVSVATVSKALGDRTDISAERKEQIRKAAREMGYLPNAAARSLKTHRSYNIGVLFVEEAHSGLTHDYYSFILESFKETVEEQGYDLTFINAHNKSDSAMSYIEHCRYRGFDGIFAACVNFYDPRVIELVQSEIPIVTVDHVFDNKTSVLSDNAGGMRELFKYVYSMGHRKIAYIHGHDSAVTSKRLTSFYMTAEELGLEIPDAYVKEAAYRDSNTTGVEMLELMRMPEDLRPTCVLCPDDYAAFGAVSAARNAGLSIPGDVSIAGYDGIVAASRFDPPLTTISQDTRSIGQKSGESLIRLIEAPKTTPAQQIVIEGSLVKGKTVGQASH